jgi:hypothetical protein
MKPEHEALVVKLTNERHLMQGDGFGELLETGKLAAQAITDLSAERDALRIRLFTQRQVDGHSHSTACSIWGDDGQGGTKENYPQPLPCNCGALVNFAKSERDALAAEIERLREALEDHNQGLRSAFAAAQRDAAHDVRGTTAYRLLANRLDEILKKHHQTVNANRAALNLAAEGK